MTSPSTPPYKPVDIPALLASLQTLVTEAKKTKAQTPSIISECVSAVNSNAAILDALLRVLYAKGLITPEAIQEELDKESDEQHTKEDTH